MPDKRRSVVVDLLRCWEESWLYSDFRRWPTSKEEARKREASRVVLDTRRNISQKVRRMATTKVAFWDCRRWNITNNKKKTLSERAREGKGRSAYDNKAFNS